MNINFVGPNPTPEPAEAALERLRVKAVAAADKVKMAEVRARERQRKREEQRAWEQARQAKVVFAALLKETHAERARFEQLFRDSCLSLGKLARSAQLLTQLSNSINGVRAALPDAEVIAAVRAMGACPDPLPALLGQGFVADTAAGWRWQVPVVPVAPKGENNNVG